MISLENVSAGYDGACVLQDMTLFFPPGKVTVIAGPNGCGKTTLLRAVTGAVPVSGGKILIDGTDLAAMSPRQRAKKVSFLTQNRQIPEISALRMVLHGRFPYLGYPRRYSPRDRQIAEDAMNRMGIGDLAQSRLAVLSGGTRQKVYLAMTLAQDTPTVLMDEPTTFLDVSCQIQMMHQARALARQGKAVVMVLHDLTQGLQIADQLAVMQRGRLLFRGTPEAAFGSGCLEEIFGVRLGRFRDEGRWHYYYRENF